MQLILWEYLSVEHWSDFELDLDPCHQPLSLILIRGQKLLVFCLHIPYVRSRRYKRRNSGRAALHILATCSPGTGSPVYTTFVCTGTL